MHQRRLGGTGEWVQLSPSDALGPSWISDLPCHQLSLTGPSGAGLHRASWEISVPHYSTLHRTMARSSLLLGERLGPPRDPVFPLRGWGTGTRAPPRPGRQLGEGMGLLAPLGKSPCACAVGRLRSLVRGSSAPAIPSSPRSRASA